MHLFDGRCLPLVLHLVVLATTSTAIRRDVAEASRADPGDAPLSIAVPISPLEPPGDDVANAAADKNNKSKKKDLRLDPPSNTSAIAADSNNKTSVTQSPAPVVETISNVTESPVHKNETSVHTGDASKLDATQRGFIVFGAMGLLAVCYYAFKAYRRRQSGDNNLSFEPNEQFRYGILSSNEHRDNYEMSNVPLTAESDDEDEMEIFDLENRKYVENNLVPTKNFEASDRLIAAKDLEILDLELPGVTSTSHLNDDDLLNLDDAIDEILTKPSAKDTGDAAKNNAFFDNL